MWHNGGLIDYTVAVQLESRRMHFLQLAVAKVLDLNNVIV